MSRVGFIKERDLTTRAGLVSAIAGGWKQPEGHVINVAGLDYAFQAGATAIADLPGLVPSGPVTLEHFGVIGDGTGNHSAAFISALTFAAGRPVVGRAGANYSLAATVAYDGPNRLDLSPSNWIMRADLPAFEFRPSVPPVLALSADYVAGALSLTVAALPTAPAAGDVLTIGTSVADPGNTDEGDRTSAFRQIEQVVVGKGSTTTNIVLSQALRFIEGISPVSTGGEEARVPSYTVANGASIVIAPSNVVCDVNLGTGSYETGHEASWNSPAIDIRGFVRPKLKAYVNFAYGAAATFKGTFEGEVDVVGENLLDVSGLGQLGYAFIDCGTTTKVKARGGNLRHVTTTGAISMTWSGLSAAKIWGGVRAIGGIHEVQAFGTATAHVDFHHDAQDVTILNPVVSGNASSAAISARGRNNTVTNPTISGTGTAIQAFTKYDYTGGADDGFVNGMLPSDWTSLIIGGGTCDQQGGLVFDNDYSRMWVTGGGQWRTSGRAAVFNRGLLWFSGSHDFVHTGAGVDTTAAAVISTDKGSAKPNLVFPQHDITIDGYESFDWRAANGTNLTGISSGDTDVAKVKVRGSGILNMRLPSGATAFSSRAAFEVTENGMAIFEVGGVVRVYTADGLITGGFGAGAGDPGPSLTLENLDTATASGQELARIDFKQNDSDNPKTVMGWIKMLFSNTSGNADLLFGTRGNSDIAVLLRMAITRTGHMIMYAVDGVTEWARFDITTQALTVNHATMSSAGIGYKQGEIVWQATSKATAVTMTLASGRITMNAASLAAGASVTFRINNTLIAMTDNILVQPRSPFAGYRIDAQIGAGFADITVTNTTAGALAEAVLLNVDLFKGSTTT